MIKMYNYHKYSKKKSMKHTFYLLFCSSLVFLLTACEPIVSKKPSKAPFVIHKQKTEKSETRETPDPNEQSECHIKCQQNATNPIEMKTCISRCDSKPVKGSIELIPGLKNDHNGSGSKNVQNQKNDTAPA